MTPHSTSRFGSIPSSTFLAALLAMSGCTSGRPASGTESENAHPMVGAPAPDFDLAAQAGGERAALAALRGKLVMVDFWATWCEPCRVSFPKYEGLAKKYGERLAVVGISEDDAPDGIAAFARETGATFLLAWDSDKTVADAYGPTAMPTTYLIDANGLVRYVHPGFHTGDEVILESKIEGILP